MDKKQLSEIDICEKFISPAIALAGWNIHDQIFREYPLRVGRVTVRGNKSHRDQSTVLRADYALFYKSNIPIAVVEAKDNNHAVGAGIQQAQQYAELLGVRRGQKGVKETVVENVGAWNGAMGQSRQRAGQQRQPARRQNEAATRVIHGQR